jgi:four helix bundle protein
LNYGESQSAESRADFSHKLSIVLKELRETHITLILLLQQVKCNDGEKLLDLIKESNELISIFQKSISTLQNESQEKTR